MKYLVLDNATPYGLATAFALRSLGHRVVRIGTSRRRRGRLALPNPMDHHVWQRLSQRLGQFQGVISYLGCMPVFTHEISYLEYDALSKSSGMRTAQSVADIWAHLVPRSPVHTLSWTFVQSYPFCHSSFDLGAEDERIAEIRVTHSLIGRLRYEAATGQCLIHHLVIGPTIDQAVSYGDQGLPFISVERVVSEVLVAIAATRHLSKSICAAN